MLALTSNNEIIPIKSALTKTNYFCANCGGILRVKEGKIKVKHFYHLSSDCGDRGESLIHKYWKDYFSKITEFEKYKIIDSRVEVNLLNNSYIPDIVLKTNENKYLIIEICYKNPKTTEYFEKYRKLSKLEKVYEIKVDFDEVIETKILYDKTDFDNLCNELEMAKDYIINYSKNGGIVYYEPEIYHPIELSLKLHNDVKMAYRWSYNPETKKKYRYPYKNSIIRTKVKIYLKKYTELYGELTTKPFYAYIYNERELVNYVYDNELGYLFIKLLGYEKEVSICVCVFDEKYSIKDI